MKPGSTHWTFSLTFLAFFLGAVVAAVADSGTFAGGSITIGTTGAATPYPSSATVSGISGTITNVTVQINGFNMSRQRDVDILLVHADGSHNLIIQADAGSNTAAASVSYTISALGVTMPSTDASPFANGATYKPYDLTAGDAFPAPAPCTGNGTTTTCSDPAPAASATLATAFNGLTANGTWKLYVVNDTNSVAGSISSWSITVTTQSTTAIVGDFVFNDLNGNGVQDAGEPGINGVTVRLLNSPSLTTAATTTTAGGGLYSFTGVAAGNYVMEFVAPTGFVFSPKDQGGNDNTDSDANTGTGRTDQFPLAGGQTDTSRDCGMMGTYVGNFVFGDTNHNGIQDAGETGIDGVTVRLRNSADTIVGTTTTAGGGFYSFFVTPAGTYSLEFVLPVGFSFSPQDQGGNDNTDSDANTATGRTVQFTVTNRVTDNSRDAGMFASGVGTYTFASGAIAISDAGTGTATPYPSTLAVAGLNGITSKVTITINGFTDPRPDDIDMLLVGPTGATLIVWSDVGGTSGGTATITLDDAAASYLPDNGPLANGTFKPTNESTVQDPFVAPAPGGTYGNPGGPIAGVGADSLASKFNSTNPNGTWSLYVLDDTVSANPGSITSWSLNITTQATTAIIGDRVFEDQNGNGIQDAGEPGTDGITVRLLNSPSLTTAATTATAGGGLYQFANVTPGNYVVEFVAPAGYNFSPKDQGGNDTTDSDANTATGRTDQFSVIAGQIDSSRDAGLIGTFVGNQVFGDTNRNGVQDAGETGVDGVTVRLLNSPSLSVAATTTTAGGGLYRFLVVTPGSYLVEFVTPAGYTFSPQDQGADDTKDSDANTSSGRTIPFTISAGQSDNTRDAGMSATNAGPLTTQSGTIAISDHDAANNGTTATPYPSTITVGGRVGTVTKVRVLINGFTAVRPDDVDMLLVGPNGASLILFSDVGGTSAVGPVTITLDDTAANFLSDGGALSTGTFKPTNEGTLQDTFNLPAPTGPYGNPGGLTNGAGPDSFASKFNGSNPNGTWSLYILDDTVTGDAGGSMTSWSLEITTTTAAPVFSSGNSTTFTVGNAGNFVVSASGVPTPMITRTGTLPAGVNYTDNGNGTATLSGTPAAGTGGSYPLTLTANNGVGGSVLQSFTLTVNQAPTITSANTTTFTVGTAGNFNVIATGFPSPAINLTNGTLPGGVNFGTGTLAGTPTAYGTSPLIFTASNGVGTNAVQSFSLIINPNAQDVKSKPSISENAGGGFRVGFIGNPGVQYTVQYSPSLITPNWQTLELKVADPQGAFFSIDTPPAGTSIRFYRAIIP